MAKYTSKPFGTKTQTDRSTPNKTQVAAAYDILSEGEIEGLANGFASVYVNDVPIIDTLANEIVKNRKITLNTTANSTTVSSSVFNDVNQLSNNNKSGLSLGGRHILIEKAGKKGTGIASATKDSNTITTSSSFFTSSILSSIRNGRIKGYVRIAGAGADGTDLVTTATFVSATEITVEDLVATTVSNVDIFIDHVSRINSISGNNAVLDFAPGVTLSNTISILTGAAATESTLKNLYNIENLQFALNTGTLLQAPIQMNTSFGQSSVIASPNIELEQNDLRANVGTTGNLVSGYNNEMDEPSQSEGTAADTLLTSAFLDVSNPSEIDEVHLTFNLPNCHALKPSSGAKGPSFVELQIWFEYSTDGGASYTSELAFGPTNNAIMTRDNGRKGRNVNFVANNSYSTPNNGYIRPSKQQYAAFVEEFVINTEEFQPFDDWRIRIRRITDLNPIDGSFRHNNAISLSTVESIVKDKLTYPHTAYAYTSFNAKDYEGQVPSRAFTLKGMKIQVPTNYLTRDETGGAAAYRRNISSGAVESSYQNWDGNFRGDVETFNQSSVNHQKVYCDNPVWVMYDMLTNNRYGMGQFVDKEHIDKYELFRLAKYCDEEIPDGNGGTEPRFTCNLYLQESGEATTVLKQLASIFHGMAIWANGEFTATADQPKQPVALFSKANVIDGQFTYEGTGERVRTNQVKVTWNDPEDSYRQSTEYVEDYENIAETGRIVRSEQLAFGCTSRGQAHRMGKWKLISEKTERETVSFETGQNAIGLLPGQVIGVQDADRDRVSYAGRVSNTGTLSTTVIPLDRTISLPSYNSDFPHELVLMYPKGGAYLIDDNATIGGVDYVKGDLIPTISSSSAAANIDANIEWVEDFRTETQKITTSAGNVSSLTVDTAFTSAPDTETIWALKLYNTDGTQKVGAIKEYKIIAIKEEDEKFSIAAAEYNREKFAEIERGYALEARPEKESPDPDDVVPAPRNLIVTVEPMESSDSTAATTNSGVTTGNKVTITWDYPENSDGSKYKFANGFEIIHNFNGDEETELVNTVNQSFTVENISAGVYNIRIRTKTSIGSVSQFIQRDIEILEKEFNTPGVSRTSLVPQGGTSTRNLTIDSSSGLAEFSSNNYTFTNSNGVTFTNDSTNVDTYKQSFSGMTTTAYLVFDSSETTDRLKALEIVTDNSVSPSVEYFATLNATNNGLSSVTGTIQIDKESNQVNGTNTLFTSEFNTGDLVKIKNGSSTTQTTSGATTTSKSVTLSSTNTNIEVGQTVGNIPTQTVDGETVSPGPIFVEAISGTTLTLSSKLTIASGTNLSFTPNPAYKRIRGIESDTLMFFEEIVLRPYTDSSLEQQTFAPDFTNDSILAKINLDSGTYSIEELYMSAGGEKGDPGPKGGDGPPGEKGDPGPKGEPGAGGAKGVKGDAGEKGIKGSQGDQGQKGGEGDAGDKGAKGTKGDQGPKGVTGDTGAKGSTGQKGDQGAKGVEGDQGDKGATGQKGDEGEKGTTGAKGVTGATGQKGDEGEKGTAGAKGGAGATGQKGDEGAKGVIGEQGPKGSLGQSGDKGLKGDTGVKGGSGLKGDPGDDVFLIYYDGLNNDVLNSNASVTRTSKPLAPDMDGGSSAVSGSFRLTQKDGTVTDWYTEAAALSDWYFIATAVTPGLTQSPRTEWTVSEYLQGEKGESGDQGDKGVKGTTGDQGPKGVEGDQGDKGIKGTDGDQGAKGSTGAGGAKGIKGTTGDQGAKGATGAGGDKGVKGTTGDQGAKGATGAGGDKGVKGTTGDQGAKGVTGDGGAKGIKGTDGDQGAKGVTGDGGAKGAAGAAGDKGVKGQQGPQGPKGTEGAVGDKGVKGLVGPQGPKGLAGDQGPKGVQGDAGDKGIKGLTGQTGVKGSDGSPGADAPYVVIGFDNTVDTNTERTTAIKTFSGLSVVKVNSVYWDAVSGVPYQNQASEASNPTLTPLTGTNALISADTIVVQDLVLPTLGAKVTGSSLGVFNNNSERYAEVCDVGTGAGFYQGFVRAKGGNGQVKTIHFLFSDGYVNTTVTTGGADTGELSENSSGVVYKTPRIEKLPGLVSESRLTSTDDTTNIPLAFRYDGTGTVTLYMYGQGDANGRTVGYVEGRFVKFGVSTPNSFGFTNQTNVSTNTTITSNTITLSGASFVSGTASISGGSYKVNNGSYTTSSSTVSNGDQITLQQTSSSVSGTSVYCSFTVSETSQAWFVTTSGTAPSPSPSGPPAGPGPCPLCCVHESMLIATGEDMKSIYDISIGDKVISHNFETGQDELTEVTDLIIVERDVDYKVNDLIMTEDHPVYLEDGSKASINPKATLLNYKQEVNQLKLGDKMKVLGGTLEEIKTIERFPGTEKNFAIQTKYNNFYANGILVDSVIRRD